MKPSAKPTRKIPRPYSAYTIYFRLERLHILQSSGIFDPETERARPHYDANEHPRPNKYAHLILPPHWYSSLHSKEAGKKRKHRKTEGGISKTVLTEMISRSWREIDAEVRGYCQRLAGVEKRRYEERLRGVKSSSGDDDSEALLDRDSLGGGPVATASAIRIESDVNVNASLMPPLPPVNANAADLDLMPVSVLCSSLTAVSDSSSVASTSTDQFDVHNMPVTEASRTKPTQTLSIPTSSSVLFQAEAPTSPTLSGEHLASSLSMMGSESDEDIYPELFDEMNMDDEFRFNFSGGVL